MSYKENYITLERYKFHKQHRNLYEGFVIGMGYTNIFPIAVMPRNMLGYQHPTSYDDIQPQVIPVNESFPFMVHLQNDQTTYELVKHSLKGLFVGGEVLYAYSKGDDLSAIAQWFDTTETEIVIWNQRLTLNGKFEDKQILTIKDKNPTARKTNVQQKVVISSTPNASVQKSFVFPFLRTANQQDFNEWLKKVQNGIGAFDVAQGAKMEMIKLAEKADPAISKTTYVKSFKIVGKVTFGLQAGISIYQSYNAIKTDNDNKWAIIGKSGLDVGIAIVVATCGPAGWTIGAVYYIGDIAGLWGNWGEPAK